jgi:DNA-binding SARP family transcriptional activator
MNFRLLGPLEVWDRGRQATLRRPKQRALLAILLLRAREAVSSDALIDALWGESPPRTARAALQNYIAQLRRALGPGVLVSQSGGYLLDVAPEQIDLGRFERLVAESCEADGEARVAKLQEALALWQGPPLADLAYEPFAAQEASRLEELRTSTLEDLIDAQLTVGAGAELLDRLEALIGAHPFRERLRGQRMLALYRDGRQAEALEAYQEARRALLEELGIEPGTALRELEQAILRQDPLLEAPERTPRKEAPPDERRKVVTILFADLAFPDTFDPELLRNTSIDALARMRAVLEGHEATIEQRAGDEVMAVFGVPRSHEDDALRAARAALELGAELGALSDVLERSGRGRIELRVGIETGEVLTGADDTPSAHGFVAGPAVTLAKRILQGARPGEILLGTDTLRLLGDAVVSDPGGDAGRLLEVVQGVQAPARHPEALLVGRRAELGRLHEAFARVVEERSCRLFLLLGEAGIGKTRLAGELAAELDDEATILVGHCVSYGKGATYLPLAEIVREARRALPELLAGDAHAELIGARLADLIGETEAGASGGETFWAVRRVFEALAAERPVLLVFEDLHWAEPTLLDLIEYLAAHVADAAILVLGLARPELIEARAEWAEGESVMLAPLSSEDAEALIGNLGEPDAPLRAKVVQTAGGNPLFIEQLLAHATEAGETESMPPSLDALLASRLDRLEAGELSVLQRAAVVGREFRRGAVVQLVPREEAGSVGKHLLELGRKGLLQPSPSETAFRFHHVLIRDAAYATLPKAQRAELHERFGRWLGSHRTGSDELIGFHLEAAHDNLLELGAAENEVERLAAEAGSKLGTAGLRAWRRADVAATVNLLGRAVELLSRTDPVRLELSCELGLALRTAGEIARAEEILSEAARTAASDGERRLELRARLERANVRLSIHPEGGTEELLGIAKDAIPTFEALGDDRSLGRAWLLSGYVRGGFHCQSADWTQAAERALVHYRRSGWPTAACIGEIATSIYYGPTPVPEAASRCENLLREVSDRTGEAHVLVWLGGLEALAGRFDRGRQLVEGGRSIYEELGNRVSLANACGTVLGEIELLADRPGAAEESLQTTCAVLAEMHAKSLLASRAAELAEAIYRQGRYDEAETWARIAEEHAATDDIGAQLLRRAVGAKILARRQSFAEAELVAREAVALAEQTDELNRRANVLLDLAEVLRLGGKPAEAVGSIELALEQFEQKGNLVAAERARHLLEDARGVSKILR